MKNLFFRVNQRIDEEMLARFLTFLDKINSNPNFEPEKFIYLIFDTKGGKTFIASKIINLIRNSKIKFFGVAYGKVHSAAIPIFLSCHVRFGYENASALLHRAKVEDENVSKEVLEKVEWQILELVAEKLEIPIKKVYKLADEETLITMKHSLGKKFFISSQIPASIK